MILLKNIYQIFDAKQPDGTWFKKYEVPKDLDLPYNYIDINPPENLIHPRFIFGTGWVEDDDAVVDNLKKENKELKDRLNMTEGALLDLADQLLSVRGGVG